MYSILSLSLLGLFILISYSYTYTVFADSEFIRQQIKDESFDLPNRKIVPYGDIDIINYLNDGKTLEAVLWLQTKIPVGDYIPKSLIELKYGILIDADLNQATGWDGIDYELYYKWKKIRSHKNSSLIGQWERVLIEHVSPGESRILNNIPYNSSDFFQPGQKYIQLSINLSSIGLSNKFKIMSYASVIENGRTVDFTNWLDFPTTQYSITTFPDPLEIRQGESKPISIQLKPIMNFQDEVNFIPIREEKDIKLNPISNSYDKSFGDPSQFWIDVSKTTEIGQHIIPLSVSIFSKNIKPPSILNPPLLSKDIIPLSESNITKIVNLNLTVKEELKFEQIFYDFWEKNGDFISFMLAGFIGGVATYFFDYLKERRKSNNSR